MYFQAYSIYFDVRGIVLLLDCNRITEVSLTYSMKHACRSIAYERLKITDYT